MRNIILAAICLEEKRDIFSSSLAETIELCKACSMNVTDTITQHSRSMNPGTAFRKGKIEELRILVKEKDVDTVVFMNNLSVAQAQRIAQICDCEVLDRTAVILQIFSLRARSRQAKLQTELACLEYDLPKLLQDTQEASEHARSSFNNRGAGEMRSSLIARKYKQRISLLRKELQQISSRNGQDEHRRSKTMYQKVALVGYTNAGKSSLLNAFVEAYQGQGTQVLQQDMLFATLDTSVRKITVRGKSFFLYDTVGFVSDLPHTLVEAFKSTLDSARQADFLLHVIDSSDPDWEYKASVTEDTLKSIGAGEIQTIRVFNKIDKVDHDLYFNMITTNALDHSSIEDLADKICDCIYPQEESGTYLLPYDKIAMLEKFRSVMTVNEIENIQEGMILSLSGSSEALARFEQYRMKGEKI